MKFELEPFHQNLTDEELLADIIKVAKTNGIDSMSQEEYKKFGGTYSSATIKRRFKGWNIAIEKAGIKINKIQFIADDELLADLKRTAIKIGKDGISQEEYNNQGLYSSTVFKRRFKSWNIALKKVGIKVTNVQLISQEDLFENLEQLWIKIGRQPHLSDMHYPISKYSGKTYKTRFGTWRKALTQFVAYINSADVETEKSIETKAVIIEQKYLTHANSNISYKHKTKREINLRLRFLIMRRDDFKCKVCGKTPATNPGVELHVDHILAWSKGGETIYENLQTLCSVCNIGKSDLDFIENV